MKRNIVFITIEWNKSMIIKINQLNWLIASVKSLKKKNNFKFRFKFKGNSLHIPQIKSIIHRAIRINTNKYNLFNRKTDRER